MTSATMARKRVSYRIDETIVSALKEQAKAEGRNANNWLENHLMSVLKQAGFLPEDYSPLGETRGGLRVRSEDSDDET
jgi:hypothetical protein